MTTRVTASETVSAEKTASTKLLPIPSVCVERACSLILAHHAWQFFHLALQFLKLMCLLLYPMIAVRFVI